VLAELVRRLALAAQSAVLAAADASWSRNCTANRPHARMATTVLLPMSPKETVGQPVRTGFVRSANLEFTPLPEIGFSGTVVIDGAFVNNLTTDRWFPIVTYDFSPWFPVATVEFSRHWSNLDLNIELCGVFQWIRARLMSPTLGSVAIYMAWSR
jgi:hypothetical protein